MTPLTNRPVPPSPAQQARGRRVVGIALLAGSVLLLLLTALVAVGVVPVDPSMRPMVAVAIGMAALIDMLIGLRFLLGASSS